MENIIFGSKGGTKKMMPIENNLQYRRAWEKRLQLEKRIKELNKKSDIEYLRILKHKIRKYANKEITKNDILVLYLLKDLNCIHNI